VWDRLFAVALCWKRPIWEGYVTESSDVPMVPLLSTGLLWTEGRQASCPSPSPRKGLCSVLALCQSL
jgi:hypothetical protein